MRTSPPQGLPPRLYLPIVLVLALAFLGTIGYFVNVGFGTNGSLFGKSANASAPHAIPQSGDQNAVEGGGPPPAVMAQVRTLRARIAAHPNDDVSLTQLGDMFLASGQFSKAIPLYVRALKANPRNVAAQTGLSQARAGLAQQ